MPKINFKNNFTGENATITAKVEVNAKKLVEIIQCAIYNATMHVM